MAATHKRASRNSPHRMARLGAFAPRPFGQGSPAIAELARKDRLGPTHQPYCRLAQIMLRRRRMPFRALEVVASLG